MKNSYSLLLFLLSCIPFGSFASTTWKLQNVEYRVDTLSHVVIGPGTTQTTLMLEGPVKLRVFYTTTDMPTSLVVWGLSVLRLRTERCIKVIRGPDGMQ